MQPGIYDLTNSEYHSSAGISRSGIMEIKRSPFHYYHRYLKPDRKPSEDTASTLFGDALHTYILEPEIFKDKFFVGVKCDLRTKEGKHNADVIEQHRGNRKVITDIQYNLIREMSKSIHDDECMRNLITGAQYEKSLYWVDDETGILCKARPDILHTNMIVDLKTTADASFHSFQSSIHTYGYAIQAAMLIDANKAIFKREIRDYIFLCIENNEPYAPAIYMLDAKAIKRGRDEYKKHLRTYKICLDKNEWPSYKVQEISLPGYAFN